MAVEMARRHRENDGNIRNQNDGNNNDIIGEDELEDLINVDRDRGRASSTGARTARCTGTAKYSSAAAFNEYYAQHSVRGGGCRIISVLILFVIAILLYNTTTTSTINSVYSDSNYATANTNNNNADDNSSQDDHVKPNIGKGYLQSPPPGLSFTPTLPSSSNNENYKTLVEKWGSWTFLDPKGAASRPNEDFFLSSKVSDGDSGNDAAFMFRDLPAGLFPKNSWQSDKDYLEQFLDQALSLVRRTRKAIYDEYGVGDSLFRAQKVFHITTVDISNGQTPPRFNWRKGEGVPGSGWLSADAMDGLSRRILHAMITNDEFGVVLGGHSSAAGHGNHFLQSYMMQFHAVMEPVFYRLGVKLVTRNIAQGGLGTIQTALGGSDIYGSNVDIMVWDSHMTEGDDMSIDLFMRQALLGGPEKRAPMIWGGNFAVLKMLNTEAGVHVGELGTDVNSFNITHDNEQAKSMPFAVRYLRCSKENMALCNERHNRYRSQCWVDRDDVKPFARQDDMVGGQASWHPGFRSHQLMGRRLAYVLLEATEKALILWQEETKKGNVPISGDLWHLTDYYNSVRSKLASMPDGPCETKFDWMKRLCRTKLNGRTEHTPRANPDQTNIRSILTPSNIDGYVPQVEEELLYEPPDVEIPALQVPEESVNVRVVASLGSTPESRDLEEHRASNDRELYKKQPSRKLSSSVSSFSSRSLIQVGRGTSIYEHPSGYCDGSYESWCQRGKESRCLLSGHNDRRGGLMMDALSGWVVLTLKDFKEGIILLKMDVMKVLNKRTAGWTTVNGKHRIRKRFLSSNISLKETVSLSSIAEDQSTSAIALVNTSQREQNGFPLELANTTVTSDKRNLSLPFDMSTFIHPDCIFEYSIDGGEIVRMDKDTMVEQRKELQRVVMVYPLLDVDPIAKPKDIEVAIRITGCTERRGSTFRLTHVYWA